ncbi:hypothetical protein [Streptacidiphilus sp. PAMC 29251]
MAAPQQPSPPPLHPRASGRRGRLKVFLGAAPGGGLTMVLTLPATSAATSAGASVEAEAAASAGVPQP